jgi:hypothetical protein
MGLSVIGAGLGRTGTLSLKMALERLDFAPCCHMVEIFPHRERAVAWRATVDQTTPDWDALFTGFRATVDWPGVAARRRTGCDLSPRSPRYSSLLARACCSLS